MEKIKSIVELSELIARDMSGKLSEAERKLLDDSLESSGIDQKTYEQIVGGTNLPERNRVYDSIDTNKGWIGVSKSLEKRRKKRMIHIILKYAAIILFPILVFGVTTYLYLDNQQKDDSISLVEIQPGSKSAVLVLANGESVDLSTIPVRDFVENDGTVIRNSEEMLSYSNQEGEAKEKALFNTLIVPQGGEYNVVLSDGSQIHVNSMSKLVFPVRFSGNTRQVTLEEGEAYFEVAKDESKPFVVTVKGIQVKVLGTSFNIKAYADDQRSYTTLVEGKVMLSKENEPSNAYFLEPDQQAVYIPGEEKVVVQKVDAWQIAQWTTGKYSFTNQTLDDIMKTLSRWYDFEYRYETERLKEIRFEGGLNKYESINPILDIISKTKKINVSIHGKEIVFSEI